MMASNSHYVFFSSYVLCGKVERSADDDKIKRMIENDDEFEMVISYDIRLLFVSVRAKASEIKCINLQKILWFILIEIQY